MGILQHNLCILPAQLQLLVQARLAHFASTAPFPYPSHPSPTPHQIFHLPPGASQSDIKSRYYDLVRSHHPDSPLCRSLPPSTRHSRFQAITAAYDALRNRIPSHSQDDCMRAEINRRRRYTYYAQRHAQWSQEYETERRRREEMEWAGRSDERWKDMAILGFGMMCLALGLFPMIPFTPFAYYSSPGNDRMHRSAAQNLAKARRDAKEFGAERKREIRKRAKEYREAKERERTGRGDG